MSARRLALLVAASWLALAAPAPADAPVVADGVVRSDAKIEVKTRVLAPIRRIAVAEGEAVRAGQLLLEMANDVQRAEVESAKAGVQSAESAVAEAELGLKIARRELERSLKVPDLITARDLELSRDAVDRAAADVRSKGDELAKRRAQLAVTQANLADTVVLAPFDGIVARVYLRVGATPRPGETAILDLVTLDKLYIEVALPLPYLRRVRPGMPVGVAVEDQYKAVSAATAGEVQYVYPEIDTTTRMFRVKVRVRPDGLKVLPGMLARVSLAVAGASR